MKKFFLLLFSVLIISCSNDDKLQEEIPVLNRITSDARIGQYITIEGKNLTKISGIRFVHDDDMLEEFDQSVLKNRFAEHTDEKIVVQVPAMRHENISIEGINYNLSLKLVGPIQLANNFTDIRAIQLFSDNVGYVADGNKLYKSEDGFYTWDLVTEMADGYITGFKVLTQHEFYVAIDDGHRQKIYHTKDAGSNFDVIYDTGDGYQKSIKSIELFSTGLGFFNHEVGDLYVLDGNQPVDIYDYYPELHNLPYGKLEIYRFHAINKDLVFLAPAMESILIKIEEGEISILDLENYPDNPQFFGNTGYVQSNLDLHKTLDNGVTWTKVQSIDDHRYPYFMFVNEKIIFGIANASYVSTDGAETWNPYSLPIMVDPFYDFNDRVGLFGSQADLYKYINHF